MFHPSNDKFKDKQGRWLTKSLFKELALPDFEPMFVLSDKPRDGLPSMYQLYMEESDPSEYHFAKKYLGGWEHWLRLTQAAFFKPYLESWRKELEVAIRARALNEVLKVAADSKHKSSYDANKLLLKEGFKENKDPKRGRPTKDEINSAAARMAEEETQLTQDLERLIN